MSVMPRPAQIVLPLLRGHTTPNDPFSVVPALDGAKIGTWTEDIDYKTLPMINIRIVGGTRYRGGPTKLALPVIEMTAYGDESVGKTERLYADALEILYDAVKKQTQTPAGYLHSMFETMGATQFSSLSQASWRIQGLIRLGIRPSH